MDIGNNNKELARISKQITLDAEKLPAPAAPSVELNGKVIHYSGEYANENAGSLWIYAYYTTPYNYTYLFDKKLNLINNGKYDGTIDLNQYYFNYSSLKDMKFKVRVIPKDSNVNTISDFSEYSKAISVSGLSNNTGSDSNSGSSASSGSSDSTGSSDSSDSSSDSSSSSTDSTSSTTTTVAKPVEGVFIDKAAAGEKVNEASVAVSLVDANGVASTVDLKTYMEAASENIVTILAQNTATGTDAQTAVSSILTAPASDSFVATVNALGGNVAINNCGTVKTAATARDAQGNLIASAGRIKNVTSGALILLVSVNEDGSIDYVEGVVDATGNVLGVFNGIPKTISVLVLVPGTV